MLHVIVMHACIQWYAEHNQPHTVRMWLIATQQPSVAAQVQGEI